MDGMNHSNMASSTMAHVMSSATGAAAAAATSAASGDMGGMDHGSGGGGMDMGGSCKISVRYRDNTPVTRSF
jgi:hypothetical protein